MALQSGLYYNYLSTFWLFPWLCSLHIWPKERMRVNSLFSCDVIKFKIRNLNAPWVFISVGYKTSIIYILLQIFSSIASFGLKVEFSYHMTSRWQREDCHIPWKESLILRFLAIWTLNIIGNLKCFSLCEGLLLHDIELIALNNRSKFQMFHWFPATIFCAPLQGTKMAFPYWAL